MNETYPSPPSTNIETDATDEKFVGIRITHDSDFNYYMDKERTISSIVTEANETGMKDIALSFKR